jgi:hypothetical protein
MRTWADVLQAARDCPVLHHMCTRVERGEITREEGLIAAVLWLSGERRRLQAREVERLQNAPPSPVVFPWPV